MKVQKGSIGKRQTGGARTFGGVVWLFFQWKPKYDCKGTVTTCFALLNLVAWKRWFDSSPKDPHILKTVRRVNLLSVVNLLRVVIHY